MVTEETNSDHGWVEIRLNGQWNAICGTHWDNDDATVLCRELGYTTGEAINVSVPSNTTGEAYDVRYECSGRESSMEECPHSTWRNSTSDRCHHHKNDAGVQCYHSGKTHNQFIQCYHSGKTTKYNKQFDWANLYQIAICLPLLTF